MSGFMSRKLYFMQNILLYQLNSCTEIQAVSKYNGNINIFSGKRKVFGKLNVTKVIFLCKSLICSIHTDLILGEEKMVLELFLLTQNSLFYLIILMSKPRNNLMVLSRVIKFSKMENCRGSWYTNNVMINFSSSEKLNLLNG